MVAASYHQKPYRRIMMESWGAKVYPSPSNRTDFGKKVLEKDPENSGSLGIAISEAAEDASKHPDTKYSLGSVLNHVLLHQTVIGQETKEQLDKIDEYPDAIFGCIGGGSSFSGLYWPYYHDVVTGKAPKELEFTAVESAAVPKVTRGYYTRDHFDAARMTPMGKMHTVGHTFVPAPIHAGGLRYHGMAPTLSLLKEEGVIKSKSYNQIETFEAASTFARTEGMISAPEPAHAVKAVIDEALRCKETGEERTLLFLLCGHGLLDMQAYDDFLGGNLVPYEYPEEKVEESMRELMTLYPWLESEG
jgi:tryptophan synthase beta chain